MSRRTAVSRRELLRASALGLGLRAVTPGRLFGKAAAATAERSACVLFGQPAYPPLLQRFIEKLDPAKDDFPTEQYAQDIDAILAAWSQSLCRSPRASELFGGHASETVEACSFIPSEAKPLRIEGPLRAERLTFRKERIAGRLPVTRAWKKYLEPLESIETAEFEIYGLRVLSPSPLQIETDIHFDLVGLRTDRAREQRVGSWTISWSQAVSRWLVQKWTASPEVRSRLTGPGFTDITANVFDPAAPGMRQLSRSIDDWRTELDAACGIDVYGNHGLACGDIDGSGHDSLYVCQPSGLPNRLYRNRGDGTFEDITDISAAGILDGTASALFADFANRGVQDLLVVRSGGPLLFRNLGEGKFQPQPDAFHFKHPPQGTFTGAAAADYDRDGLLDIYFSVYSYYQGLNQYSFPTPYYDAQNGPPNFLFRNQGDGTFLDVTVESGLDQNNNRFSFAAAWCDYDNNGWPDLYVANDFGRKNLYQSDGKGRFTDVAREAGVEDYGPGMSVCWLDCDGDGRQDLYVANMWLAEGNRITANDNFLPDAPPLARSLYRKHNAGNSLYRQNGQGSFDDKTREAGSAIARWSWSCAAWDFDHDGWDDLYVANGFVSGSQRHDLQSFFWRQVARRSFAPAGSSPDYETAWNAVNELLRSDYSWSGYERNVFFANNHDGTFSDVAGTLRLDLRDDSRAFVLTDLNGDGRLEVVLKNRTGPQLRVLQNNLQGIGNSVAFRLKGRTSNRDAIGASITLQAGDKRQTKFISAGSGFASQHTKELFFGVGQNEGAVSISIRWPNGSVQRHGGIPINCRVQIEEGSAEFQASPFSRKQGREEVRPAALEKLAPQESVSTWLIAPVFGPNIRLQKLDGGSQELLALRGVPTLLSFFRLDCGESRQQLAALQQSAGAFNDISLRLVAVALNADSREAVASFARAAALTFPVTLADDKAAGAWNTLYRFLFDRRRDLQAPISFLLDETGAIVRIYRGFVDPAAVVQDSRIAPLSVKDRLQRALPFAGPYYGNAMLHNYFTDGIAFVEYGYVDEARDAFQRVVDADPSHAGAWFNLGTIYLGKKMYGEARKALSESVRLNPQDGDAWNNLGLVSGESGDYPEALVSFQNAARANPNHALAVQNMMRILQFQGRPAEAQRALEELIPKAPDNAGLHLAYGMSLAAQNRLEPALTELQTAQRLNPSDPDTLNDLGALLVRMGRGEEAIPWFERCARIAPDSDRPILNLANIYGRAGQAARARQILEQFSSSHPDDAEVRNALTKLNGSPGGR